jgi:hypothetical protein
MGFGLVALASGATLYAACVAALSLHAGGASALWWLAAAAVALCHAASGYLTMRIGGAAAATGATISLGITGIISVAALLLVFRFPIHLPNGAAILLLSVCAMTGACLVTVAYLRRISHAEIQSPSKEC